ncbi:MAG: isoleucyl-tRNA synthetase, partial [Candidatus Parcubacteria bacterium]
MAKFHLPTLEEEQLKKWEDRGVFNTILERNKEEGRPPFVFFEGPPTANGKPGIHHLLSRSFKDAILRYRTMQGYRIDRKAGWDTHGLPVELEVEKQLGFTKKQDIENYGIAAFNEKCRESVWKYLELWQKSTRRLGFWVDMSDPYITYKNDYVESLWSIVKKIDSRGLLYQGYRVTPQCPRCVTSLSSHELAQGYKDTEDPSVFVKFALADSTPAAPKFFLVWTTTPWTLPANVALAVGPEVTYVEARMKESGETFILARELLSVVDGEFETVSEKKGMDLIGTKYQPLYAVMSDAEPKKANAYQVYGADFVSTADGTGIVHIAPAFGEDDAALGKIADLPTLFSVDGTGMVTMDVPGKGQFFKKADAAIMEDMTARGILYKSGKIKHSYPFCWRCDTPILYYAKSSWYVGMSKLRGEMIERNDTVNWVPDHIRDGRFGEWLKDAKDWNFSRERYWGTPLPVWKCTACDERRVIGSLSEMDEAARPKNRFFLQRHGRAESNHSNTVCSYPEPIPCALIDEGRAQIAKSAAELKEQKIDLVFSSDLARTKETAEIIAKELGLPVIFDERLREIGFGVMNGTSEAEYVAAREKVNRFTTPPAEGAESLNDVRRRAVAFWKEINAKYSGKNVLVVSH